MGVYRREGNTPERAWNELVRRVNDLADECGFDADLEEVDANHVWSKSDISTVQDKLTEICDENEFDSIPATWKQSIIDEFTEAIERGCCGECSREPVLLDAAEFPWTTDTNGISGGDNGLVFLREFNLFDVPFSTEVNITPELEAIRAEGAPAGKHFWAITKQFDAGVGQDTKFGVIDRDGTLRDPEALGPAQPDAPDMFVNGGAVYHFVALCQDFNTPGSAGTFLANGGATFFNGDPSENFGAFLNDWRELTAPEEPEEPEGE